MFKRSLLTMLAALSMLLFAAVMADWVRSYWVQEAGGLARYRYEPSSEKTFYQYIDVGARRGVVIIALRKQVQNPAAGASVKPNLSPSVASGIPMSGRNWEYSRLAALFVWPTLDHRFIGFGYGKVHWTQNGFRGIVDKSGDETYLEFPHAALAVLMLILPWAWLRRHRRLRSQARVGLCKVCGYDLRASPLRCPECGTPNPASEMTTLGSGPIP